MKKILTIILFLFVFFIFDNRLNGEETEDVATATRNKLCIEGEEYSLCQFNKDEKNYFTSYTKNDKKRTFSHNLQITVDDNLELTKSYLVTDKQKTSDSGQIADINETESIIYGMCYKGYVNQELFSNGQWNNYRLVNKKSDTTIGTGYYFKIFSTEANPISPTCAFHLAATGIIVSDDIVSKDDSEGAQNDNLKGVLRPQPYKYSETRSQDITTAVFNEKANKEIDFKHFDTTANKCPEYLVVATNSPKFIDKSNHYFFGDKTETNFKVTFWSIFTDHEKYKPSLFSCTEKDDIKEEERNKCYEDAISKVGENVTCDNIDNFSNEVLDIIKNCDLEMQNSATYQESLIKNYSSKLSSLVKSKLTYCNLSKCISSKDKLSKILDKLKGKIFENGCSDLVDNDNYGRCVSQFNAFLRSELTETEATCVIDSEKETDIKVKEIINEINKSLEGLMQQKLEEQKNLVNEANGSGMKFKMPEIGFGSEAKDCHDLVGEAVSKIIKSIFNILRIAGVIIAIVNAMITLIPAVVSKNADALKKAANKCVIMAIVLASIGILPSIIRLISLIFGYDVSCMF